MGDEEPRRKKYRSWLNPDSEETRPRTSTWRANTSVQGEVQAEAHHEPEELQVCRPPSILNTLAHGSGPNTGSQRNEDEVESHRSDYRSINADSHGSAREEGEEISDNDSSEDDGDTSDVCIRDEQDVECEESEGFGRDEEQESEDSLDANSHDSGRTERSDETVCGSGGEVEEEEMDGLPIQTLAASCRQESGSEEEESEGETDNGSLNGSSHDSEEESNAETEQETSDTDSRHSTVDREQQPEVFTTNTEDFLTLRQMLEGNNNQPIESNILASKAEIILNALTFSTKYKMSFVAQEGLFKLLNSQFRREIFPDTRYQLDKLFFSCSGFHFHFYCYKCFYSFGELDTSVIKSITCGNQKCRFEHNISDLTKAHFFVTVDLPSQLEVLFNDPDVLKCDFFDIESTSHRSLGVIRDLYDGEVYKTFAASLDFSDGSTQISICISDDGTPLFTSANFSIWPIFLSVLELPPILRKTKILLGALWFGKGHPSQDLLLKPFVDHINQLSKGFEIKVENQVKTFKAHLICCCADAPARASIQCIHQFNGKFGCNWCLHPGELLDSSVNNTRIYPLLDEQPDERSHSEVFRDGEAAIRANRRDYHVNGVLGVSPLFEIRTLDIVNGMVVEYLHLAARGIPAQLTEAWLGGDGSTVVYYIGAPECLKRMNFLIEQLPSTKEIRRSQRKFEDRKLWNARDWENFTIYFSLPILKSFHEVHFPDLDVQCKSMPMVYVKHWALYVEAMHIILRTEITHENLDRAHRLLVEFVARVEELYGRKHMTYNMHILTHLCPNVKRWGQPWAISAFCFESMNGAMKRDEHANKGVPFQILRAMSQQQALKILQARVGNPHTKQYEEDLSGKRLKNVLRIGDVTVLGKTKIFDPSVPELYLCDQLEINVASYVECSRIVYKHCVYRAPKSHPPQGKTDNAYAMLLSEELVFIRKIIASQSTDLCYLIVSKIHSSPCPFMPDQPSTEGAAIRTVTLIEEDIRLVPVSQLKIVCVRIAFPTSEYIIRVPNVYNID